MSRIQKKFEMAHLTYVRYLRYLSHEDFSSGNTSKETENWFASQGIYLSASLCNKHTIITNVIRLHLMKTDANYMQLQVKSINYD